MFFVCAERRKATRRVMKKVLMCVVCKLFPAAYSPYRIPNGFRPKLASSRALSLADLEQCHEIICRKKQNA